MDNMAGVYCVLGQNDKALGLYEEALAIKKAALGVPPRCSWASATARKALRCARRCAGGVNQCVDRRVRLLHTAAC